MSSARNHAKRSHRSEQFKRQAIGSMARRNFNSTNSNIKRQNAISRFFSNLLNRRKKPETAQANQNKNINTKEGKES